MKKMGKELKKCDWCEPNINCNGKKDSKLISGFTAMSPLIEKREIQLKEVEKKYGAEWWIGLEKDDPKLMDELSLYDQATCTIGRGIVCKECLIKDDKLYVKYRKISIKGNKDSDKMVKIIAPEEIDDVEGAANYFINLKKHIRNEQK
jgi:hypothetical protein